MKRTGIYGTILLVWVAVLTCGFSWSLMWGELSWPRIERAVHEAYPLVEEISAAELRQLLTAGESLYLVDVRESEEYGVSHLPGGELVDRFSPDRADPEKLIVCYCSVGLRSAEYAERLRKKGRGRVVNLRGGIFAWANQGYPLEAEDPDNPKVHPYSARWGSLLRPELRSAP